MDVLGLLAHHARPLPTMTIARECGIPKSSAHHLLNVMRDRHFVSYDERERAWGLGVAAFETGSAYLRSAPVQRLARPLLVDLTQRTGDTSHLAVLHGADALYVDKEQADGPGPRLVTEVGVRLPAHLTAVGLAILAALPETQVRALYADEGPLVQRTDHGPADLDGLLEQLAAGRRRGYAFDDEMVTPGISCVAAPVFSHDGAPAAAIGITYVTAQRSETDARRAADLVREAGRRLSTSLGHAGLRAIVDPRDRSEP